MGHRIIFAILLFSLTGLLLPPTFAQSGSEIPAWIKNNADWWERGLISDRDFAAGLGFMVKEGIIEVENVDIDPEGEIVIDENIILPKWIQNNARWWADGAISDNDFKSGIQYMLKEDIISFKEKISIPEIGVPDDIPIEYITKFYASNKWYELSSLYILEIKNYESDILNDKIDKTWNQYSENKNLVLMEEAMSLEKSHDRVEIQKKQSLNLYNQIKTTNELVEFISKQIGINVLDLEELAQEPILKIENDVHKLRSAVDLEQAKEDAITALNAPDRIDLPEHMDYELYGPAFHMGDILLGAKDVDVKITPEISSQEISGECDDYTITIEVELESELNDHYFENTNPDFRVISDLPDSLHLYGEQNSENPRIFKFVVEHVTSGTYDFTVLGFNTIARDETTTIEYDLSHGFEEKQFTITVPPCDEIDSEIVIGDEFDWLDEDEYAVAGDLQRYVVLDQRILDYTKTQIERFLDEDELIEIGTEPETPPGSYPESEPEPETEPGEFGQLYQVEVFDVGEYAVPILQLVYEDFGHQYCQYPHWHAPDSTYVIATNLDEVPDPASTGCGYGSTHDLLGIAWMTQSEIDAWEEVTGISLGVQ